MQNKRAIIFDFDGTLVDTTEILFRVFNDLASQYHYPPISKEAWSKVRDEGIKQYLSTHAKIPFWKLWRFTRRARARYRSYSAVIRPFPDIKETLDALRKKGLTIGIVSSNSTDTISRVLKKFGMSVDFIVTSSIFGKSRTLNALTRKYHFDKNEILYIGDEVRDVEACRKSGIDMLAVTWGFNSQSALHKAGARTIDQPFHLLEAIIDTK